MDIIMPNLDGVSACHLIRQFDHTPIIAMTSNIRSDDISMYFQHGMNDVLPKPFTKEGLLSMLEKHLGHLKKGFTGKPSLKSDDSPSTSPTTIASWHSPGNLAGMPPSAGNSEYTTPSAGMPQVGYVMPPGGGPGMPFNGSPQSRQQYPGQPQAGHRRQISDISGGTGDGGPDMKRQHMYAPQQGLPGQPMQNPMLRR